MGGARTHAKSIAFVSESTMENPVKQGSKINVEGCRDDSAKK